MAPQIFWRLHFLEAEYSKPYFQEMSKPEVLKCPASVNFFETIMQLRITNASPIDNTVNPLYTDTRYNGKNRYNNNLTVTKPSLKR